MNISRAQVFDSDGFFITGDIGQWNSNGSFSIIDRKKNLIKLPQGEYVSLEQVETVALGCKYVEQIYVHADFHHLHLVAIIVPHRHHVHAYAASKGMRDAPLEQVVNNKEFINDVLKELQAVSKEAKLNSYEIVRAIRFELEPFTLENNSLTPSMKLKRNELRVKHSQKIEEMYKELEEATKASGKRDVL